MKRDKYEVDADAQIISLTPAPRLAEGALVGLTDATASESSWTVLAAQ
jgi:hypothetical protein